MQSYRRVNDLYLNLETLNLCGLFLINFNIKFLTRDNMFIRNLVPLDLVDCNCNSDDAIESLNKIFPKYIFLI